MWKKSETEEQLTESERIPMVSSDALASPRETATIGASITVRGDVSGGENLLVEGRVEGTISLQEFNVTVGADGHITADVRAKVIEVRGKMEGDLHAGEQVILRRSASVMGNIAAPRVTLEDGCRFKGSIDMEGVASEGHASDTARIAGLKPVARPLTGEGKQARPGKASDSHAAAE